MKIKILSSFFSVFVLFLFVSLQSDSKTDTSNDYPLLESFMLQEAVASSGSSCLPAHCNISCHDASTEETGHQCGVCKSGECKCYPINSKEC